MRRLPILVTLVLLAGATAPLVAQADRHQMVSVTRVESRVVERVQDRRVERSQRNKERETQTERYTKTVNIGAAGELFLSNIAGDIQVTRASGNSASIEVIKTARADTIEEAKAQLPLVQVDITERGARADVKTRYPEWDEARRGGRRNISVSVAFNITAPEGTRLTIKSISGGISVRDIQGPMTLESVSGTLRIANAGRTSARTISGNVELSETKIDGPLDAGSVSGSVRIRKVSARSMDLGSISGEVAIEDASCGQIQARSMSGRVDFIGELEANGRYGFSSHSGNVRLAIAGKTGFEVEATSFSGSVQSDIPLTLQGGDDRRRQRRVRGTYGDGGATLELTTFSGSILITKR